MIYIEVIIAYAFLFFLLSILVSGITEIIAMLMNKRGKELKRAIHLLLDNANTQMGFEFYNHPLIAQLHELPKWTSTRAVGRRILNKFYKDPEYVRFAPSYIPDEQFSDVVFQLLSNKNSEASGRSDLNGITAEEQRLLEHVQDFCRSADALNYLNFTKIFPNDSGTSLLTNIYGQLPPDSEEGVQMLDFPTYMLAIQKGIDSYKVKHVNPLNDVAKMQLIREQLAGISGSNNESILHIFLDEADGQIDEFKHKLSNWYNQYMNRVAGWYKRRATFAAFWVAFVICLICNVDAVEIASNLIRNGAMRSTVVAAAEAHVEKTSEQNQDKNLEEAIRDVKSQISELHDLGIPLTWPEDLKNIKWGSKIFGLFLAILSISLGAPFWYDVFSRFIQLRSTGKRSDTEGISGS